MSRQPDSAAVFAALGDKLRWRLIEQLSSGEPYSIASLTVGSAVTRQAVSKHLRVLSAAGLVSSERQGREQRFRLNPQPLQEASRRLEAVAERWGQALHRLKAWVEKDA